MIRVESKFKKALLIGTVILLGCDFSLLFAAPGGSALESSNAMTANLQAQQLQAQLNALNNSKTNMPNDAVGNAVAKQILMQQQQQQQTNSLNSAMPNSGGNAVSVANSANIPTPPNQSVIKSSDVLAQISADQGLNNQKLQAALQEAVNNPPNLPSNIAGGEGANIVPPSSPALNANVPVAATTDSNAGIPSPVVSDNDLNNMAFNAMVKNSLPMSGEQIQKLRSLYMASQYAASNSPTIPPRPTASSVFVDLAPGSTPPVVRLAQGFVTSLVFVDSSGAPWPIASYDVGNPSAFNIQWDKTSNTLMIQATVLYTYGNLAVKLRGLNTPVMITLIPGQKAVDYRVDMRIPGVGPEGHPVLMSQLPSATSSDLLNVLDGVPPSGSTVLKVQGGDCQAWLSGARMFVRTRLTILSPGWDATLSSADGMHAYQMQPTPMLLVSQHGQVSQLKVEGF